MGPSAPLAHGPPRAGRPLGRGRCRPSTRRPGPTARAGSQAGATAMHGRPGGHGDTNSGHSSQRAHGTNPFLSLGFIMVSWIGHIIVSANVAKAFFQRSSDLLVIPVVATLLFTVTQYLPLAVHGSFLALHTLTGYTPCHWTAFLGVWRVGRIVLGSLTRAGDGQLSLSETVCMWWRWC